MNFNIYHKNKLDLKCLSESIIYKISLYHCYVLFKLLHNRIALRFYVINLQHKSRRTHYKYKYVQLLYLKY